MDDYLIYTFNDDKQNKPFCTLKLLGEKFKYKYFGTNQSKIQLKHFQSANNDTWF